MVLVFKTLWSLEVQSPHRHVKALRDDPKQRLQRRLLEIWMRGVALVKAEGHNDGQTRFSSKLAKRWDAI